MRSVHLVLFVCFIGTLIFARSIDVENRGDMGIHLTKTVQVLPLGSLYSIDQRMISDSGCVNENISQGRSYDGVDVNISDCFFTRFEEYSDKGGVIYAQSSSVKVYVSNSMFYNCMTYRNGGAICFDTCHTFVMKMTCVSRCRTSGTSSSGHFGYLRVYNPSTFEYCSLSSCSYGTTGSWAMLLYLGDQRMYFMNFSMNNAKSGSCFRSYNPNTFIGAYCTFANNIVSDSVCISLYNTYSQFRVDAPIHYSNIVNNNSPQYGLVMSYDVYLSLKFCIIDSNQGTLFYSEMKTVEIANCFISHTGVLSTSNSLSTSVNNSFTKHQTNLIQYFDSYYCHADETLPVRTPKISNDQTPTQAPDQTPLMTYNPTPLKTIANTPDQSANRTPLRSNPKTEEQTNIQTPLRTIYPTYLGSPWNTVSATNDASQLITFESTLSPTTESSSSTALIVGASAATVVAVPSIFYFGSKFFRSSGDQQVTAFMDP